MANAVMTEKIVVNFTQGTDYIQTVGKMAQKAEEARDTAIVNANVAMSYANQANQSAINASNSADSAASSATNALNSANSANTASQQANMYAESAFGASAPAWDSTATYNYPECVAYTDGNTYRCVGANVGSADVPGNSPQWVRITLDTDDFWEEDSEGRYMPSLYPTFATRWVLDAQGNIEPSA